ncbi:MAG: xanthine dehydrogenase accessory protein XdhC [Bacteroidetes bacterium]|nr:MAG: xanthine dehydrogenase accessory protein XdhC [Bacteroidota bacterium]
MNQLYREIERLQKSGKKAALCTIIATKGSVPRKVGAKMLVYENGDISGTIGGGALEYKVIEEAQEQIRLGRPKIVKHSLVNELDMCCGGSVDLFIEPIQSQFGLYIFGAGHVGQALARFANEVDFRVTLIDERLDVWEPHEEISFISGQHQEVITSLSFNTHTAIVILTHDHAYDREILALCLPKEKAYLGMIGSQRKVEIARKNLLAAGIASKEQLDEVRMPIGLDIGAQTPEEIAVSILSELIQCRAELRKQE